MQSARCGKVEVQERRNVWRASLTLARDHSLRSIAFPAISTGIFGYPLERATDVAVGTVESEIRAGMAIEEVVFACFSPEVLAAYRSAGVKG
jgi:O-acetyl-ADP-ribose deacetylase (regulator of RNase III)